MTLRVVFAGTPAFAVPPLLALAARHSLVGVLTQPDRPAGRGQAVTASPVKIETLRLGLPVLQPQKLRGPDNLLQETLTQLQALQPDVMVVVAYGLILPRELLTLPRLGCLNIHASLLPRWRGAAPIQRAIQAGDDRTGVSIMQMDEGLDTGAVLREAMIPIPADITAGELHDQLSALGAQEIVAALDDLQAGRSHAQPQAAVGISYAAKLAKAEARVNWRDSAAQIDQQIRAFNPWPVAQCLLQGEAVRLLRSGVAASRGAAAVPGQLLGLNDDALEISCSEGVLRITQLQRAGRKPVAARDFFYSLRLRDDAPPVVFE
jgi:methionyl-tRNA formyltransferase